MENWIKKEVIIDFDVPSSVQYLIDLCEKANSEEDYAYFNYEEALDYACKELFAKDILNLPYEELHQSVIRNVPLIIEKFNDIRQIFMDIPESYHDLYICSNCRKEFYIKSMEYRIHELLVPAYNRYAEKGMEMSLYSFISR